MRTTLISVIAARRGPLTLSDDLDFSACSVVIIMELYLQFVSDNTCREILGCIHYLGEEGKRHHDT